MNNPTAIGPPHTGRALPSTELRVFISSTFRDLQEEREHLIKKIFPEIRSFCRERGVTFTDIDLRWGLTEEEAILGRVIRTCLEEVDKCRPYFIGMIGNRYGWIPDLHEVLIDPELLSKYPWVEQAAIDGTSLTEMEFIHGVFNTAAADGDYAYFYHRPEVTADEGNPEKLSALIERVRQGGYPLREFSDAEELGQLVHDDLRGMIERYWPEEHAPSALERERRAHAAFAASRRRAYIPNPMHLKEFNVWLAEGRTPLVINAESGLGKSALAAYLTETYRAKHPDAIVLEYYVGASERSGSAAGLVRQIIEVIRERFALGDELPSEPGKLLAEFPNWLWRLGHLAMQQGQDVLVVLDALNQLDESGRRLRWLPPAVSENLKLLVTATPGDAFALLRGREWQLLELASIAEERVRQSIILRYLGEFHKGIAPEQLRRITSDAKACSPLYLRVVAEELRLHGEHETLGEAIERYVTASDLDEIFQRVLERMERDYGAEPMQEVLSLVWVSRAGLSETELLELTGLSRLELSRLLFALDYHLLHRDGLLGFFHDYLRRATEKRYLFDEGKQQTTHFRLAEYLQSEVMASMAGDGSVGLRIAGELAYQLHAGGASERLRECLSTMPVFLVLYSGEMQYEVLGYWSAMVDGIEGSYRDGLERWGNEDVAERSVGVGRVAQLLERLGRWTGATELERERLTSAIMRGDRIEEAASRQSLGWLLQLRGDYAEALEESSRALDVYTELGDRRGIAWAIGNMGLVYYSHGEYDRAIESYKRQLRISEELGDRRGIAWAIGNMGGVYYSRGEYDRAIESFERKLSISEELGDRRGIAIAMANMGNVYYSCGEYDRAIESYKRKLRISEELGDRSGITMAIGDMGSVYYSRGEYDRAIECYKRKLRISEELGDRHGIAMAIGDMGLVYYSRGEYDRAIECSERQLRISEELGDRRGIAMAIGDMGLVYYSRGEYDRAIECYQRAAEEHRAIGFRFGLSYWLYGVGQVLLELVQADGAPGADARPRRSQIMMPGYLPNYVPGATVGTWRAMSLRRASECAEECVGISDELSMPDTQFDGRILLGRVEAAEGHVDDAIERFGAMLAEATDDEQQAELHYWLWKLGASGHAVAALVLYEALYATIPKHDYHKRIEELQAAGEQS